MPRAMSITSPITALAVGPMPAPGPRSTIWPDAVAFQHHHIGAALQLAQGAGRGHKAGRHALLQPPAGHLRHAQKLDAVAHVLGQADVVDRDIADAFQLDRVKG